MCASQGGYEDDDFLALSGLQHLSFCERQWALIHVECAWEDNADTLRGHYFHERVDTAGYGCAGGVRSERLVRLVSRRLGLYGIADIVEYSVDSHRPIMAVEYKVGHPKAEDWDRLQLTAQTMCLEEMYDCHITTGAVFYGETRRREKVEIGSKLRGEVERLAMRAHELRCSGTTPPRPRGVRCSRCSLKEVCMPELFDAPMSPHEYWREFGEGQ